MDFERYVKRFHCVPLQRTEQSSTFLVFKNNKKRVVKKPINLSELEKELNAYRFLRLNPLLRVPEITEAGIDYIELEFLESLSKPSDLEIIQGISNLYLSSRKLDLSLFPELDLSKDKLTYRLNYVKRELVARRFFSSELFSLSENFICEKYDSSSERCLVHGDLKSLHAITTSSGLYFIDLALMSRASPWYDLAFLYMEKRNKDLGKLSKDVFNVLGENFGISVNQVKDRLKSAIFYRSLYNVGFSARHRNDIVLQRTLSELEEIIKA